MSAEDGAPAGERSPALDAIVQALLGGQQEQDRPRLAKLCERLGIDNSLPERNRWALVGMALAHKEPEFRRGRGRPKLKDPADSIDAERAKLVVEAALNFAGNPGRPRHNLSHWIKLWKKLHDEKIAAGSVSAKATNHFGRSERTLRNSIDRGLRHLDYPADLFTEN